MKNEIHDVQVLLKALEVEIRRETYAEIPYESLEEYKDYGWGGAGVIVTKESPPVDEASSDFRRVRYIVTPHANEVGWLFRGLWQAFKPILDHMSKHIFFERLADAVLQYQESRAGKPEDVKALLNAVLSEGNNILDDMKKGSFSAPPIVSHS